MIELDSILVVFMLETLAALTLLVVGFVIFSSRKNASDQSIIDGLIDEYGENELDKAGKFNQLVSENCTLSSDELSMLVDEVSGNERMLYMKIVQIFLKKDVDMLKGISEHIDKISEPYCRILLNTVPGASEMDAIEGKMTQLVKENTQLSAQLGVAMSTMDEISAEYTRVFSGSQTELELENSSKKMFKIFADTQQKIRKLHSSTGVSVL